MQAASKIRWLSVLVVLLSGCLNDARFSSLEPVVPVQTKPEATKQNESIQSVANPSFYLVKPGDTLYSIAFRFGLDYKKLARANGIDSNYRIYEGQSLALKEASAPAIQPTRSSRPASASPPPAASARETSPSVTHSSSQNNDASGVDKAPIASAPTSWVWPHNGKIVRTYRSGVSNRKGIDLQGRIGDSVVAATNGVVVYAGNGLQGYGNLIILEHSGSLLSAYAFNEKMLVQEKDRVRAGQQIATMGKQGDQPGLHFEIRRNGKPVDPLTYLPNR